MINPASSRNPPSSERRHLLAGLLALPFALSACHGGNDGLARTVLRVANIKGSDESFFADAGVDDTPYRLEQLRLGGAAQASEALNAGAYDLALQSNIAAAFLPAGSPVRLAGFIGFAPSAFKFYVRRGGGIDAPHQIKGKRVAYMRGGPLHLFLLEILKQEGLTLGDIQPVALSALDSASAFLAGDVDVVLAGMFAPSYQIEQGGGVVLVDGGHYPDFARNNGSVVAVHRSVLEDRFKSQAVADYLRRLQQTWNWLDAHQDVWSESLGRLFGVPPEFIIRHRPRPKPTEILPNSEGRSRLLQVAQSFADAGAIPAVPDLDRLWDSRLETLLPSSHPPSPA